MHGPCDETLGKLVWVHHHKEQSSNVSINNNLQKSGNNDLQWCYCGRVVPKNSLKHNRVYVLNNMTQMLQVSKNSNIKINYTSQHL